MQSYEALQKAIDRKTREHAKRLGLSLSTVNKWQEPADDYTDSGALNPLDRIERIIETALILGTPQEHAFAPMHYLDVRFGRVCVDHVPTSPEKNNTTEALLQAIKEFGELASVASAALEDGRLTRKEARDIMTEWEDLLRAGAIFIHAIKGVFDGR